MDRKPKPWRPRRRRGDKRREWRFVALVAAVAGGAFYATLSWPPASASGSIALRSTPADDRDKSAPASASLRCTVAYINDGDTLRCGDGTRIRLHAVAARESDGRCSPGHPCPSASAAAATAQLERLAAGRTLACRPIGRSYDRISAICWTPEGEEINCAMVRSGTALIWDRFNREEPICRS